MNKMKNIGLILLCGLILTACGDINNSASSTNKTTEKITQSKQSEETEKTISEDSPNETSTLANLDTAIEKLKTGNITEISGSDFIVGEDIDPGRYIIKPSEDEPVQFKIHYNNGESQTYYLGMSTKELIAFKLLAGARIELSVKRKILEAEILNDPLPHLSKGETAYISGNDVIVGEDLPAGQYTIRPIENEKVQFKIHSNDRKSQSYYLGMSTKELKSFKLSDGDRIETIVKKELLEVTRTK